MTRSIDFHVNCRLIKLSIRRMVCTPVVQSIVYSQIYVNELMIVSISDVIAG